MKNKKIISNLNKKINDLELEIKLRKIKNEYVEKGKDTKCFFTSLANIFGCAAEVTQAINEHKKGLIINNPIVKDNESIMVGKKETKDIFKGGLIDTSFISNPKTWSNECKEYELTKELCNEARRNKIVIPKKREEIKDLEIVLKAGQSYSIDNNSGCELIVKFE